MKNKKVLIEVKTGYAEEQQNGSMFVSLNFSREDSSLEQAFIRFQRKLFKDYVEESSPPVKRKKCKNPNHTHFTKGKCWVCGRTEKTIAKARSKFSKQEEIVSKFGDAVRNYSLGVIDGTEYVFQNYLGSSSLATMVSFGFEISGHMIVQYELLAQLCVLSPETSLYREKKLQLLKEEFNNEVINLLEKEYETYKKEKEKKQ